MKICITAKEGSLDSELDPRFGRAQNYLIYDTESKEFKVIPNESVNASGGAGTAASQLMSTESVDAVISGNYGPNAATGLQALDIEMYTRGVESISKIINKFEAGELTKVASATVEAQH